MNTAIRKAMIITLVLGIYSGGSMSNAISDNRQVPDVASKSIVLLGASYAKGLRVDEIKGYKLVNKGVAGDTKAVHGRTAHDLAGLRAEHDVGQRDRSGRQHAV